MEEVAAVRRAALAAVDDVEPDRLHERIAARLDDASLAPGVLALVSAGATSDPPVDLADGVADRAAGVQLIYEDFRSLANWPTTTLGSTATATRPTWISSSRTSSSRVASTCSPGPRPPTPPSPSSVRSATTRQSVRRPTTTVSTPRSKLTFWNSPWSPASPPPASDPHRRSASTRLNWPLTASRRTPNCSVRRLPTRSGPRGAEQPSGDGTEAAADH